MISKKRNDSSACDDLSRLLGRHCLGTRARTSCNASSKSYCTAATHLYGKYCRSFYIVKRRTDEDTALQFITDLRSQFTFVVADEDLAVRAGLIKSNNALALADAFAIATASTNNATLLTGDPEILKSKGKWKVRDIS